MKLENYAENLANEFVNSFENGTFILSQDWEVGVEHAPLNLVSNRAYRGLNFFSLLMKQKAGGERRWATAKQAEKYGLAKAKTRASTTPIVIWRDHQVKNKRTERYKKQIYDYKGKRKVYYERNTPFFRGGNVINVRDYYGATPLFSDIDLDLRFKEVDRLIGRVKKQLGMTESFSPAFQSKEETARYYQEELKKLSEHIISQNVLGEEYSALSPNEKKLQTELATFALAINLGLGYQSSYINPDLMVGLRENPKSLLQAIVGAERVMGFVLDRDRELKNNILNLSENIQHTRQSYLEKDYEITAEDVYINVPYHRKDEARNMGAKWDAEEKSWYAPSGSDYQALVDKFGARDSIEHILQDQDRKVALNLMDVKDFEAYEVEVLASKIKYLSRLTDKVNLIPYKGMTKEESLSKHYDLVEALTAIATQFDHVEYDFQSNSCSATIDGVLHRVSIPKRMNELSNYPLHEIMFTPQGENNWKTFEEILLEREGITDKDQVRDLEIFIARRNIVISGSLEEVDVSGGYANSILPKLKEVIENTQAGIFKDEVMVIDVISNNYIEFYVSGEPLTLYEFSVDENLKPSVKKTDGSYLHANRFVNILKNQRFDKREDSSRYEREFYYASNKLKKTVEKLIGSGIQAEILEDDKSLSLISYKIKDSSQKTRIYEIDLLDVGKEDFYVFMNVKSNNTYEYRINKLVPFNKDFEDKFFSLHTYKPNSYPYLHARNISSKDYRDALFLYSKEAIYSLRNFTSELDDITRTNEIEAWVDYAVKYDTNGKIEVEFFNHLTKQKLEFKAVLNENEFSFFHKDKKIEFENIKEILIEESLTKSANEFDIAIQYINEETSFYTDRKIVENDINPHLKSVEFYVSGTDHKLIVTDNDNSIQLDSTVISNITIPKNNTNLKEELKANIALIEAKHKEAISRENENSFPLMYNEKIEENFKWCLSKDLVLFNQAEDLHEVFESLNEKKDLGMVLENSPMNHIPALIRSTLGEETSAVDVTVLVDRVADEDNQFGFKRYDYYIYLEDTLLPVKYSNRSGRLTLDFSADYNDSLYQIKRNIQGNLKNYSYEEFNNLIREKQEYLYSYRRGNYKDGFSYKNSNSLSQSQYVYNHLRKEGRIGIETNIGNLEQLFTQREYLENVLENVIYIAFETHYSLMVFEADKRGEVQFSIEERLGDVAFRSTMGRNAIFDSEKNNFHWNIENEMNGEELKILYSFFDKNYVWRGNLPVRNIAELHNAVINISKGGGEYVFDYEYKLVKDDVLRIYFKNNEKNNAPFYVELNKNGNVVNATLQSPVNIYQPSQLDLYFQDKNIKKIEFDVDYSITEWSDAFADNKYFKGVFSKDGKNIEFTINYDFINNINNKSIEISDENYLGLIHLNGRAVTNIDNYIASGKVSIDPDIYDNFIINYSNIELLNEGINQLESLNLMENIKIDFKKTEDGYVMDAIYQGRNLGTKSLNDINKIPYRISMLSPTLDHKEKDNYSKVREHDLNVGTVKNPKFRDVINEFEKNISENSEIIREKDGFSLSLRDDKGIKKINKSLENLRVFKATIDDKNIVLDKFFVDENSYVEYLKNGKAGTFKVNHHRNSYKDIESFNNYLNKNSFKLNAYIDKLKEMEVKHYKEPVKIYAEETSSILKDPDIKNDNVGSYFWKAGKTNFDMSKERENIYINVSLSEKDTAKSMGAWWDKDKRSWFVPPHIDPKPLVDKYGINDFQDNTKSIEDQFLNALADAGLEVNNLVYGEWTRARVVGDKQGATSAGYVLHLNEHTGFPVGRIQNYKTGEVVHWRPDGALAPLTDADREERIRLLEKAKKETEAKKQALRSEASKLSTEIYQSSNPFLSHDYVLNKGIVNTGGLKTIPESLKNLETKNVFVCETKEDNFKLRHDLKENNSNELAYIFTKGDLVIPAQDIDGNIKTLQIISDNGWKGFIKHGEKTGSFATTDGEKINLNQDSIYIAEGYATADTVAQILENRGEKKQVICAFDAGNLRHVVAQIREKTDAPIFLTADNDFETERNVGVSIANEIADDFEGIGVVAPETNFLKSAESDWNDLKERVGLDNATTHFSKVFDNIFEIMVDEGIIKEEKTNDNELYIF